MKAAPEDKAPSLVTTQTDDATRLLRSEILRSHLAPGTKIPIREMAARFGVNVAAMREALSRLMAEGLTVAHAQRGFSVAPVSAAQLKDLTATRVIIEHLCLRDSLAHGGVEWETAVVAAGHRLQRTPERAEGTEIALNEDWSTAHNLFHAALVGACRSPSLLHIRESLSVQTERYRYLSVPLRNYARDVVSEHQEIFAATLARDTERLCALMEHHLWQTATTLLSSSPVLAVGN